MTDSELYLTERLDISNKLWGSLVDVLNGGDPIDIEGLKLITDVTDKQIEIHDRIVGIIQENMEDIQFREKLGDAIDLMIENGAK